MTDRAQPEPGFGGGEHGPRVAPPLAARIGPRLRPEANRVIAALFVPGEELPDGASRGYRVIERVLELDDAAIRSSLAEIMASFSGRHRDLRTTLAEHYAVVAHGRPGLAELPEERRLLIGAYFTMEYSVEAAALFNPSMVAHPDQDGLSPGQVRYIMSLRAVGEGHRSSIEFRTGTIGPGTALVVDPPGTTLTTGTRRPATLNRALILARLADLGTDSATASAALGDLPDHLTPDQLQRALADLHPHLLARQAGHEVIEQIHTIVASDYETFFPADIPEGERLLWPASPTESHGMEDLRLTRFTEDDGQVSYYGTYTAYDGAHIAPQLLRTTDFQSYEVGQLAGSAARDKGMALFPRRVGGRYLALSRWDRENISLAMSYDTRVWHRCAALQTPRAAWELVQLGNCGPPIETPRGWLVLTHGVGPMRTYRIGAVLLDLVDPTQVRAVLPEPLLPISDDERDGYVPNVTYSCGALHHGNTLTIPYGNNDTTIGFAQVDLPALIARMRPAGPT